jgi:hypothetical protein
MTRDPGDTGGMAAAVADSSPKSNRAEIIADFRIRSDCGRLSANPQIKLLKDAFQDDRLRIDGGRGGVRTSDPCRVNPAPVY